MPRCFLSYEEFCSTGAVMLSMWLKKPESNGPIVPIDRTPTSRNFWLPSCVAKKWPQKNRGFSGSCAFGQRYVQYLIERDLLTATRPRSINWTLCVQEFDEYCQKLEADTLSFRRRWLSGLGVDNNLGEAAGSPGQFLSQVGKGSQGDFRPRYCSAYYHPNTPTDRSSAMCC